MRSIRRIMVATASLALVAGITGLGAAPAQAGQLNVLGVTVTWPDTMYRAEDNCSKYFFDYANNIGFELLTVRLDILDPFGASLASEVEIGVPNRASGTWDVQLCPFHFTNGNGPYTFRLTIKDYYSTSRSAETPFVFTSRPSAPSAPTNVVATAGNSSAEVSWSAPEKPGTTAPLTYRVSSSPSSAGCTVVGQTVCTVDGLTNGTSYSFTVTATNSIGTSPSSRSSSRITPVGPPSEPRSVETAPGDGTVEVSWEEPESDGGSRITSYRAVASPGGQSCTSDRSWSTSCTITGLTNGVSYLISVTATNAAGTSRPSAVSRPTVPMTVPGAPRSVTATATSGSAAVSWLPPTSDGGSAISTYTAIATPGGAQCETTSGLTCTIVGLRQGASYRFTVTATNAAGSSLASSPSEPVTIPGPPSAVLKAKVKAQARSVALSWSPPASTGGAPVALYEYRVNQGQWKTTSRPAVTIRGLAPRIAVSIEVRATNVHGPGPSVVLRVTPR